MQRSACNVVERLPHTPLAQLVDVWLESPLRARTDGTCPTAAPNKLAVCSEHTPIGDLCYYVATTCLAASDADECCVRYDGAHCGFHFYFVRVAAPAPQAPPAPPAIVGALASPPPPRSEQRPCTPGCTDVPPPASWVTHSCSSQRRTGQCPERRHRRDFCAFTCGLCVPCAPSLPQSQPPSPPPAVQAPPPLPTTPPPAGTGRSPEPSSPALMFEVIAAALVFQIVLLCQCLVGCPTL
eukprot:6840387-Prymnesium_polylepis.1